MRRVAAPTWYLSFPELGWMHPKGWEDAVLGNLCALGAEGCPGVDVAALQEAVQLAREKEQQLAAKQEVCNETMLALWEECKPCLKHTCMRFYSRTCHSGSGLVGRQVSGTTAPSEAGEGDSIDSQNGLGWK